MATDEKELTEEELWADQDKYAIYQLKHVLGTRDYRSGVAVTRNWSDDGLLNALNRHLKIALTASKFGPFATLYAQMRQEPELWVSEKVVSHPTIKDCVEHMGLMYKWERYRPTFLVPDTQMKKIIQYVN